MKQNNQKISPPAGNSKHYDFTQDEYLYISEKRAGMELADTLMRRFIAAKVMGRLRIDGKTNFVKVSDNGAGIDVTPMPPKVDEPKPQEQ